MSLDFSKIKLVIWDLDDTFWKGTLSEEGVTCIPENVELVKTLTDSGVVNAICSKNDYQPAIDELDKLGVKDVFVFNSIDWTPKGPRISALIKDMGLRPVNCLFIDDNIVNLNEAKHYAEDLMIAEPTIIPQLIEYFSSVEAKDKNHSRLNQYKVLEKKQASRHSYSDNESFLYASGTEVEIRHDCLSHIDRIHELILRTNQLNFTKVRSSKEELVELLNEGDVEAGYVNVNDNFGDYGTIGFYAMKNHKLIHFLFSCRTIGQGVEQYVYAVIGHPEIQVEGNVISELKNEPAPAWINQKGKKSEGKSNKQSYKILFKGPCDLSGMISYLQSDNIICEFTHPSETRGNYIEHHNHSINYLRLPFVCNEEKQELLKLPFNDESIFETKLYDDDIQMVFLSTVLEPALCVFENKKTHKKIAYGGLFDKPLTDSKYWKEYVDKTIFTGDNDFTYEFLEKFSDEYEYVGLETPEQYVENLKLLMSKLSPNVKVCLLLGSEIEHKGNTKSILIDRHIINKRFNDKIRDFAKTDSRISLIDFTQFIKSQDDYADRITHFSRRVYYEAAMEANRIMNETLGVEVGMKNNPNTITQRLKHTIQDSFVYNLSRKAASKLLRVVLRR